MLPLLGAFDTVLGQLLLGIVGVGLVLLVGRFVMHVAWRVVTIAALVVGVLFAVSSAGLL